VFHNAGSVISGQHGATQLSGDRVREAGRSGCRAGSSGFRRRREADLVGGWVLVRTYEIAAGATLDFGRPHHRSRNRGSAAPYGDVGQGTGRAWPGTYDTPARASPGSPVRPFTSPITSVGTGWSSPGEGPILRRRDHHVTTLDLAAGTWRGAEVVTVHRHAELDRRTMTGAGTTAVPASAAWI